MWSPCFGGTEVQMQSSLVGLQGLWHCAGTGEAWGGDGQVLDLNRPWLNLPAENL